MSFDLTPSVEDGQVRGFASGALPADLELELCIRFDADALTDADIDAAFIEEMERRDAERLRGIDPDGATPPARHSARCARMAAAAILADQAVALARGMGAYAALAPSERMEQLRALGVGERDGRAAAVADELERSGVGGASDEALVDFIADPFPLSPELLADVLIERVSAELVRRLADRGVTLAA